MNQSETKPVPCKHGNLRACGFCMADAAPKCMHGNPFYCGLCEAEKAPKCKAHGKPWFCGFCGPAHELGGTIRAGWLP